jgi:flagellar hook protein FlgE
MSLFSTLSVGASGLGVASMGLGVAGDNIANIGTTGYKHTRVTFSDFLPQDVFGLGGTGQLGSGAATNRLSTQFGQGNIATSDSALDMAIGGNGFFVVNSGNQSFYTRNGEFYMDDSGYVTSAQGLRLQGYNATNGSLSPVVSDLRIGSPVVPATVTSNVVVDAVLSAETIPGADLAAMDLYGTGAGTNTLTEAGDAADFAAGITIYDSLGVSHDVSVLFERSGTSDWTWRAVTDATGVYDGTGTAFSTTDDSAFEIASGTVSFDTAGKISAFTQTNTSASTPWTFLGAASADVAFDFGMDAAGVETEGAITMAGDESSVTALTQDGRTTGSLSRLEVAQDGTITGSFTNGENLVLGQVALATFTAQSGLVREGGTLFSASQAAGDPAVGAAASGDRGTLSGNALESSNVDLEDEFVSMITAQRMYQANAKVITAADESLQTLVNLI